MEQGSRRSARERVVLEMSVGRTNEDRRNEAQHSGVAKTQISKAAVHAKQSEVPDDASDAQEYSNPWGSEKGVWSLGPFHI